MKIGIINSVAVPQVYGGMNRLVEGLAAALREQHPTDVVNLPVDERFEEGVLKGYYDFYHLDVSAYDAVISLKAPTFMVRHPVQVCYLPHRMRVFYDLYEPRDRQHASMRRLIHWMDNWGLAPQRIPHVFTVGRTVSRRLLKWGGIASTPIAHPSTFRPVAPRKGEYFFACGRLHPWKRFDMLIAAMKRSKTQLPLLISGTGPQEDELREMIGGDLRIQLLGHVDEAQLAELYSGAVATIFNPINEDLGMVTFESFLASKPVITTSDSGEPTEIVRHHKTGLLAQPTTASLAEAIDWMDTHREETAQMGRTGQQWVTREVTWERIVGALLDGIEKTRRQSSATMVAVGAAPSERPAEKIRLLVTDNQILDPPEGGGRIRIWELFRHLPDDFVTTYLGAHDHPGPLYRDQWLAPNLREVIMPLTTVHFKAHEVWRRLTGGDATVDVTIPLLLGRCSPRYHRLVRQHMAQADVVICSHPWMAPFVPEGGNKPFIYDSHNCEAAVKEQLLRRTWAGRYLLRRVQQTERLAVVRSAKVLACSPLDTDQFARRYGVNPKQVLEIPNGVDCERLQPAQGEEKLAARVALGLPEQGMVAIFTGSAYGPNLVAVEFLACELAPAVSELMIVIVGGVGEAWLAGRGGAGHAPNVRIAGKVSTQDLDLYYHAADLALNPMTQGSGTNIKMLDFMAAGLPIVTTPTGARGLAGADGEHWRQAPIEQFVQVTREVLADGERQTRMARAGRRLVEEQYAWRAIAGRLAQYLRELTAAGRRLEEQA